MNIAVVGWGSLIWCPGSRRVKTKWRKEGPAPPIEFARITKDGRMMLVIYLNCAPQRTYWALSEFTEIHVARRDLQDREGCPCGKILSFPVGAADEAIPRTVAAELDTWLAKCEDIEAVILTGLTTNRNEIIQGESSPDDGVPYLEKLDPERKQTMLTYELARAYVWNAPLLIQTEVRTKMRKKGWTDAKLSDVLFKADGQG